MKIVTIVGARPQFIKCSAVSEALPAESEEILVHTGQHYDDNMSESFFRELRISQPKYHLGVGSASHGVQTAAMLNGIEGVLSAERPDFVLVYGDTNSTLAGSLAAAKLNIPVAHVEAGLRSFNRRMPEEINRILTDHVSTLLFCPTAASITNLTNEGVRDGVFLVGDVMLDALRRFRRLSEEQSQVGVRFGLQPKSFFLATLHRAENTDDDSRLGSILAAFRELAKRQPVIWPIHPRTRHALRDQSDSRSATDGVTLTEPLGYLDMLWLTANARAVLTDSGGLQKEAYWLATPCLTMRNETEWVETLQDGMNRLVGTNCQQIVAAAESATQISPARSPANQEGTSASARIADLLSKWSA